MSKYPFQREPKEKYAYQQVYNLLGGHLPPELRRHYLSEKYLCLVARAGTKLPKDVIEWANEKILFISSTDCPATSISFRMEPFKGAVFLSESLLKEPEDKQAFIIAHEIAHYRLKHQLFGGQTETQSRKEEDEANQKAIEWLGYNPYIQKKEGRY